MDAVREATAGAAPTTILAPGRNCMAIDRADRLSVIVDADDYFRFARQAMTAARRRIMLVGWDFDGRIALGYEAGAEGPEKLGDFVLWLVERNPDLEIFLLRWDVGALKTLLRGSTFFTLLKWMAHPRIHTKLDGAHPTGSSHHQKIVVIDDALAFCGGIDMTADRWDTRAHAFQDERRRRPFTRRRYKPWHDASTALTGPAAARLGEICRQRWLTAGGAPDPKPIEGETAIWPEGLWTTFRDLDIAVSRSAPELSHRDAVHEIEDLYVDQIRAARRIVYAESQYFASRRIAEAIAHRLEEPDGPEIVVINPVSAQGWLEPIAMDTARARLVEALRQLDRHGRFRMYHPVNEGGEAIYVHAKILVVDDRFLRVGSSNMNNRSMRLDTECDVTVDAALAPDGAAGSIVDIRNDLLAEHLGRRPDQVSGALATSGSLIAAIEALRGPGRSLVPYETPELNEVEAWLADNKILDPEGPAEMFEPLSKRRHLIGRLRRRIRQHRHKVR
ncbi:phospholipase D-like domain-containing protein [Aureimonas phyllosphaerae]|uniref:Phospholipase D n=1 Tax=Aureimonas phyllosphaerae TaxID=1166078 RepID=A0A7W6BZT1_9HYPH|nr:phosphatidylserine/phosphatidylglycerophosphate/cardiolipin synthase-like enzyme [Aureimonas phyllosphaerae]MBB3960391.1 phosphatidylserine/phosphatidylglycerophosphate/cardiolipin synthase-like enzyme [Aureimonas phyllosphaerae]SFF22390.1 Phosphatidylserine/phosphatidylglycerophosphate/cardiolipin synthase [Aureimonas phyllosphaerae]